MSENPNSRLETFCDAVFAIAITLLILDMKVPPLEGVHSRNDLWLDVVRLWPSFFALSLSFTIIFISWYGHHNLMKALDKTSVKFQFANGFFMFTVIVIPFTTAFMAEYLNTPYAQPAIVIYCLNGLFHNIGWNLLFRYLLKPVSLVKSCIGADYMKKNSQGPKRGFLINSGIVILSFWLPYVALIISVLLWIYWVYVSIDILPEKETE